MRKRWVSVLLVLVMTLGVLPAAAFAEESGVYAPYGEEAFFALPGENGDVYEASEEEGEAYAPYAESADFIVQDGVLKRYTGSAAEVTVPEGVTHIGTYAFSDCVGLTSVTIPNGVTSIMVRAFEGCTSLNSVTVSDSVTSISSSAFLGCTDLRDVYFDGTKSQWKTVNKSANLNSAVIHYGATDFQDRKCPEEMTYNFANSQDGFKETLI